MPDLGRRAALLIPYRDDPQRLARCLAELLPQLEGTTEVVVIDNGSRVAPALPLHPALRLIHEPRAGAAQARNAGVAATTAPLLLFLDCDCVPASDWLARAREAATRADVTGGRIDVFDEGDRPGEHRPPGRSRTGAQAFEAVFAFDNRAYVERKGFSVTANLATCRDVFEAVGPFRDGVSEDLDWCRRATALGFRLVYDDAMRVSHPSRGDWPALERKWRRLTREGFGVEGPGAAARLRWGLKAAAMPGTALVHAPRVLAHPALSQRERLAALGTLVRLRTVRAGWMLRQALTGRP